MSAGLIEKEAIVNKIFAGEAISDGNKWTLKKFLTFLLIVR